MADDLRLRIDTGAEIPVYRQIMDGIRTHLVSSALKPGDRLPPVRRLAVNLGVHHNTVAEAYRQLADEGWLELTRGRGAEVRDRQVPRQEPETESRFNRQLNELIARFRADGLDRGQIQALLGEASEALRETKT